MRMILPSALASLALSSTASGATEPPVTAEQFQKMISVCQEKIERQILDRAERNHPLTWQGQPIDADRYRTLAVQVCVAKAMRGRPEPYSDLA